MKRRTRPAVTCLTILVTASLAIAAPEEPAGSLTAVSQGEARLDPIGRIEHDSIDENSGLVILGGAYYTHNDGGDKARVFRAGDAAFTDAVPLPVAGAENVDWEAMTTLKGDLLACDIGDNARSRNDLTLYRVRYVPPKTDKDIPAAELVAAYPVAYPDGAHDSEAAYVLDGKVHLIVKNRGEPTTDVFRFDALENAKTLPTGERNMAVKVASLELPPGEQVTDAAVHEKAGKIVLLTYSQLLVYSLDAVSGAAERTVTLSAQQCEAMAFDGDDLLITNEQRAVFRIRGFLGTDVTWMLPARPTIALNPIDPEKDPVEEDGLPTADTPLTPVHLLSGGHGDKLRIGVVGTQLMIDGEFPVADGVIRPTKQDSPRLGTSLLLLFPRTRSLTYGDDDVQIAIVVREDEKSVTAVRIWLENDRGRPELLPGVKVRGRATKGVLRFRLVAPLDFLFGDVPQERFGFNAIGIGLRKGAPKPTASGPDWYAAKRPFMAAQVVLAGGATKPDAGDTDATDD